MNASGGNVSAGVKVESDVSRADIAPKGLDDVATLGEPVLGDSAVHSVSPTREAERM